VAVLVAIAVQLFQSAENWWPMGRKLFGALLVTAVLGLAVVEAVTTSRPTQTSGPFSSADAVTTPAKRNGRVHLLPG